MGRPQWWESWLASHPKIHASCSTYWHQIRPFLPPVNFITLHYTYFIVTSILGSVIFYGTSSPAYSIDWWDSLFMVMSALTASGLNTINVSQLTTFQQVELCVLMMIGSQVLVSYVTIAFRQHVFEKRFEAIVEAERAKRKKAHRTHKTGAAVGLAGAMFGLQVISSFGGAKGREAAEKDGEMLQKTASNVAAAKRRSEQRDDGGLQFIEGTPVIPQTETPASPKTAQKMERGDLGGGNMPGSPASPQQHRIGFLEPIRERVPLDVNSGERPLTATTGNSIYNMQSHPGAAPSMRHRRGPSADTRTTAVDDDYNFQTFLKQEKSSIGRNGQFINLTEEKREYLGGVEYRALKFLSYFVLMYFILWQLFGAIALGAWMSVYAVDTSAVNAQNPWWAGIFLAISAYNNAGFTLLDAGFLPFQSSYFLLTVVTLLSLAGPAAFPAVMRLLIWCMAKLMEIFAWNKDEEGYGVWKEGFDFILKFPRRVYTSLFPSRDTWLFVLTFGGFVMADWVLILILSIGNPVMEAIPLGQRIFDALFEGFSIPSGGYAIFPVGSMYPDMIVLWLLIFYTAAYPHIITMRKTNVYEERSLGIYEGDHTEVEQLHSETSSVFDVDGAAPGDEEQQTLPINNNEWDSQSVTPSTRSIKKLRQVGRRGTAFVGRQIQRRMTGFQGVGVASVPLAKSTSAETTPAFLYTTNTNNSASNNIRPLRRAMTVDFATAQPNLRPASVYSLNRQPPQTAPPSLVSQQVRGQLSHDVWWIALALFLVTLIETRHSLEDPVTFSVFNILFEIVSGYTNIGISVGLSDQSYSMSGGMYTGSKIVMILVMLRGRHRGLPVALDRAVKLPAKGLEKLEKDDEEIRRSVSSNGDGTGLRDEIRAVFGHGDDH